MTVAADARTRGGGAVSGGLLLGAAVAVALGAYGAIHDATGRSPVTVAFTETINAKVYGTDRL